MLPAIKLKYGLESSSFLLWMVVSCIRTTISGIIDVINAIFKVNVDHTLMVKTLHKDGENDDQDSRNFSSTTADEHQDKDINRGPDGAKQSQILLKRQCQINPTDRTDPTAAKRDFQNCFGVIMENWQNEKTTYQILKHRQMHENGVTSPR